jgi:type VI secretion system secreted protein Hcp
MAFDAFLKLTDILGESVDSKHKDEIELLSYNFGAENPSLAHGGGGGEGKVSFNDFNFVTRISRASPILMKACANGEHIKDAVLTLRKAGGGQQEYLKIAFSDVLVTKFDDDGTAGGTDSLPTESISLNFAKVKVAYTVPGTTDTTEFEFDLTSSDLT